MFVWQGVREAEDGGGRPIGELTVPWSVSLYSNKEPSRLPGIRDDRPLGDGRGFEGGGEES